MATKSREQPPWTPPTTHPGTNLPSLKVLNSLTRRKDAFVPIDATGKTITFYACGPTPYDDAHLGHAKNYVSIDIIRRLLRDYFGYNVKFVMNSTNIDDKIIIRARQQYFLARFKKEKGDPNGPVTDDVLDVANKAFQAFAKKNLPLFPTGATSESYAEELDKAYGRKTEPHTAVAGTSDSSAAVVDPKLLMHLKTARSAINVLRGQPGLKLAELYASVDDILSPYLDSIHKDEIDPQNYKIFADLTERQEDRFFEDMHTLNVLDPDVLTKVTDYVPQIITFTQKIIDNGFAYATSDGVYFDVDAFERGGHPYARLEPWNRNDQALQADGEGSLSQTASKRSDSHFALWKASKSGEPAWPSPWGPGRPGWHIECSVMASEEFGQAMDIHAGGVDLRFPHHDNELAQSEAFWSSAAAGKPVQWVNYFFHTGHLSIAGMKMSKSLKNFTTIREALERPEWTPRSLRICFLLGLWSDGAEIGEELLKATAAWEGRLDNFFLKGMDIASNSQTSTSAETSSTDKQLLGALDKAKADLDAAFCDSFNTPVAMRVLSDLVTEYNSISGATPQTTLTLAQWLTRIVTILGLDAEGDLSNPDRIGWAGLEIPNSAKSYVYPASQIRDKIRASARSTKLDYAEITKFADEASSSTPTSSDTSSQPYAQVLTQFQTDVKRLASEQAPAKDLLALCDQLRDTHLWNLGIYLEDRDHLTDGASSAMVRPLDRSLIEERAQKEAIAARKLREKADRENKQAEQERALREKAKISHKDMFKTDEYAEWDDDGLPTKDAKGEEITKSRKKKLIKEWEKQKKLHDEYLKTQG